MGNGSMYLAGCAKRLHHLFCLYFLYFLTIWTRPRFRSARSAQVRRVEDDAMTTTACVGRAYICAYFVLFYVSSRVSIQSLGVCTRINTQSQAQAQAQAGFQALSEKSQALLSAGFLRPLHSPPSSENLGTSPRAPPPGFERKCAGNALPFYGILVEGMDIKPS